MQLGLASGCAAVKFLWMSGGVIGGGYQGGNRGEIRGVDRGAGEVVVVG